MPAYTLFVCKVHGKAELRPSNSIEVELRICKACIVTVLTRFEEVCNTKGLTLFQGYKELERMVRGFD